MEPDDQRRLENYLWAVIVLLGLNTAANIVATVVMLTMIL